MYAVEKNVQKLSHTLTLYFMHFLSSPLFSCEYIYFSDLGYAKQTSRRGGK